MKNKFFLAAIVAILVISGCSKTPDNAAQWAGVYTGTLSATNNISQVTIAEEDPATVNIQLQIVTGGVASVLSMPAAKLQASYTIAISATGTLAGSTDQLQYTGTGTLATNGDTLTITGHGRDIVTDSLIVLSFYGVK